MMLQMHCISLSSKVNPLKQPGSFRTHAWPLRVENRSPSNKSLINCSSQTSFYSASQHNFTHTAEGIIKKRIHESSNKLCTPQALQDDDASKSEAAPSFSDVLKKKLIAISHLTRFYVQINNIVAITSVCCLPLQSLSQVTPTFLMGVLKAIVPIVMNVNFVNSLNQICDLEIDKINKSYLPLPSGDLSITTAITICLGSALMSIALGVMSGSPAVLWVTILWGILGIGYSVPLPFLRWKSHPFLAPFVMMIVMGISLPILFFIHSQKYVLGGSFVVTRLLIFATIIMSIFGFVNGLLKDLPDIEGDNAFGVRTLCVLLGKEKVFSLSVNMMLLGYGSALIAGAFATPLTNKLVTIISHSVLAFLLWRHSKRVDLHKFESTFGFYMFIWKLNYIEYILIHFLR